MIQTQLLKLDPPYQISVTDPMILGPLSKGEGQGVRIKKREQLLPFSIILSLVEMDYSLI